MKALFEKLVAWGPLGILVITILDGAGIPNPSGPDLLLLLYASQRPESAFVAALFGVAGSTIGSYILFLLARKGGEVYLERHTMSRRGRRLRRWFHHYGLISVFIPALVPIPLPLKLFVICAGALGIRSHAFLLTLASAKTVRYLAIAYLGRKLGEESFSYLAQHKWDLLLVAIGLLVFCTLLVKITDRLRGRPDDTLVRDHANTEQSEP